MTEFSLARQGDTKYEMNDLIEVLRYLLSPDGCPWDRVQTHESLRKNMIEEAYEVVDAIDSGRPERIADELGDVLLQVVFHAVLAERDKEFSISDVTDHISRKLISRHSHVFGSDSAVTPDDVLSVWEKNKQKEKGHRMVSEMLEDIPEGLPALMRAGKLQKRAAKVGFDWPDAEGALDKVKEELEEIGQALSDAGLPPYEKVSRENSPDAFSEIEEEFGDFLFAAVNYARLLGIDPEVALSRSNHKFTRRFSSVEELAIERGMELSEMDLQEMDSLWEAVKKKEKSGELL
jgi:tetrapyrrole methylase family protein/MazG family protein